MPVLFDLVEDPLLFEGVEDGFVHVADVHTLEPAETPDEAAVLVQRRDDLKVVLPAESEVLRAGSGRNVHDPGAFVLAHLVPLDDPMLDSLLRGELVERSLVPPPGQVCSGHLLQHLVLAFEYVDACLHQIQDFIPVAHLHVGEFRMHRCHHVGRKCPGCRRPHEQRLPGPLRQRELQEQARVHDLPVAFSHDFVL